VTSTPTIDAAGTQAAQAANEKATAQAQAALNDKATADAKAAADAKATTDAKAAADKATADAKAAEAKATADAQAALDAQATADAIATQNANATATQAAKEASQTAVAAQATQTAEAVLAVIQKDLTTVGLSTDAGSLGWLQSDSYTINMDTAWETIYHPFAEDLVASDFVLKTDVTWKATTGMLICGFIFRSESNFSTGDQYLLEYLRLSGYPAWMIFGTRGQRPVYVTGKQPRVASVIDMGNGATNRFVMVAEGYKFTIYINDQRIGHSPMTLK
jgi:hypothetical protein